MNGARLPGTTDGLLYPTEVASSELVADLLARNQSVQVRVRGQSMSPSIRDGDLLTIAPTDGRGLRLGDVLFYRDDAGRLLCHRLLRKRGAGGTVVLGLRGDAQTGPIEWVQPAHLLGKAVLLGEAPHTIAIDSPRQRYRALIRSWAGYWIARQRITLGRWRRSAFKRPNLPTTPTP